VKRLWLRLLLAFTIWIALIGLGWLLGWI